MALSITQEENTITLEGTLNTSTINNFKTHFGFIQNAYNNVTLDIDNVEGIDTSALNTLKNMYKKAVLNNNPFFVTGYRSEEIYEDFHFLNIA